MAIQFGAGDQLFRTANIPANTAANTMMAWVRFTTDGGTYQTIMSHDNDSAGGTLLWYRTDVTGNPLELYINSNAVQEGSPARTVNTWMHLAIVRTSGTNCVVYVDGNATGVITNTTAPTSGTYTMRFGSYAGGAGDALLGEMEAIKCWNVALSTADIAAEYQYRDPQTNVASINFAWRCITATADANGYNDTSANARNATTAGTLTSSGASPAGILGNNPSGGSGVPRKMVQLLAA